jgi:hypothetical protein
MKPLFGTLAFIAVMVLGVLIAGCLMKTQSFLNNVVYSVDIGDPTTDVYVELKDGVDVGEPKLRDALAKVKHNGGKCEITFLRSAQASPEPHYCDNIHATMKTDRVIKSKLASNRGHDSSSANDPNLMHRVTSPISNDITDVTVLLK